MLGMYGDLNQEMEVERIYARKTVVESTAHGDDYSNNARAWSILQIGHLFGAGLYTVEMVSQPIIDELKQKCRRLAHDFKLVSHVTVLNIFVTTRGFKIRA